MYIFIIIAVLLIALARALVGPSFADRAIAVSLIGNLLVLLMVIYSINTQSPMYLDIAIVFALLSFTGLLAVAKYAVWHEEKKRETTLGTGPKEGKK